LWKEPDGSRELFRFVAAWDGRSTGCFLSARGQTQSVHSASRLVALLILGAVAFSVRNGALRHPGGWAQALLVAVPLSLLDSGITSLIVRECRSADGFVGSTIEPEIR
jgi:hypothetical protein